MVQTHSLKKPKIVIIGGPTASGKSAFAVQCALRFNGEIISADSMQIYRHLDIGTGKITEAEKKGVAHHMIDILEPDENYSVGLYLQEARKKIDSFIAHKKLPIIAGGTGLYINAIINGLNFSDANRSEEVRNKWKKIASQYGNLFIYDKLKKIDPFSAEKINPNDLKRVIRALEIYEVTGKTKSESAAEKECDYDYKLFILDCERNELYEKINARVDKMFADGLMSEAQNLRRFEHCQSMQAIGYKQIYEFMAGKYPDEEMLKEDIKKQTRHYAKRQLTFFKGMKAEKTWITPSDFQSAFAKIEEFINN